MFSSCEVLLILLINLRFPPDVRLSSVTDALIVTATSTIVAYLPAIVCSHTLLLQIVQCIVRVLSAGLVLLSNAVANLFVVALVYCIDAGTCQGLCR